MNPARSQLQKIVELLQTSTAGVICLPETASIDAVAAATSMYLGLRQIGKNVTIASSGTYDSSLHAADKIHTGFSTSGDNLVITFPYKDGSIEKVDYFIQGNKFNIVVVPGANSDKLTEDEVQFSYAGGDIQFVITIDTPSLKSLGQLYLQNQEQFKGKKIINIDRHVANSFYGTVNFVSKSTSSNVELIMAVLSSLNVQYTKEIASNLYAGILAATQNFSSAAVNPQTFEASAYLMKIGAGQGATPLTAQPPAQQQMAEGTPQQQSPLAQKGVDRQAVRTVAEVERAPSSTLEGSPTEKEDEEWLKPNIFKPGELL